MTLIYISEGEYLDHIADGLTITDVNNQKFLIIQGIIFQVVVTKSDTEDQQNGIQTEKVYQEDQIKEI